MKSKLIKLGIGIFVLSALAFKAYDYRMESNKDSMVADWKWAKDFTLRYIEAMPDKGLNFRPTDSVRTFREQMLHITTANMGIAGQALGAAPTIENLRALEKSEGYQTKAELAEVVAKGYDFVIANIELASADKFGEEIKLFGQYDMTVGDALQKAFIHQNHHRGQCAVYIRMEGGIPPEMKLF
ncbi:MAG: DinB family protein [Cyclobacteriaceae bacterium]|nr:DinB family protein [Cyclobacteriaceae bacterium]